MARYSTLRLGQFFGGSSSETLAAMENRWTPIHLAHSRVEVDNPSIKWRAANWMAHNPPVATGAAALLGPGATATPAAMRACAGSNAPVCWIGEDGRTLYTFGSPPNLDIVAPCNYAAAWADNRRTETSIRMFAQASRRGCAGLFHHRVARQRSQWPVDDCREMGPGDDNSVNLSSWPHFVP